MTSKKTIPAAPKVRKTRTPDPTPKTSKAAKPASGAGNTPVTPIRAKERQNIARRLQKRYEQLRRKFPEVHGKAVDFISHSIQDDTFFFTVRFMAGDLHVLREYIKPVAG